MRLWSLHPKYLDRMGLLALWRESLLAKSVLVGKTQGYKNHPQLIRFKNADDPLDRINQYLTAVYDESLARGYNFDKNKIDWDFIPGSIIVNRGQIEFEVQHLLDKLKIRDIYGYDFLKNEINIETHPIFIMVEGDIEMWEKI
jgi:hypothetical protein